MRTAPRAPATAIVTIAFARRSCSGTSCRTDTCTNTRRVRTRYGEYSRLPFDQALLVATLAPDRAILIDTNLNDYNDGAMTDNMSLQIAKAVYRTMGVDGDTRVKFNSGTYVSKGDPHGAAGTAVEGKFLSDCFFGTHTLTDAEANRLNLDPYLLQVSNHRTASPYDYYWGGFNTITGGRDGAAGTDGWYSHKW